MSMKPLDHGSHAQCGDNGPNPHIGVEQEAHQNAQTVCSDPAELKGDSFQLLRGDEGLGVVGGDPQICGEV